MTGQATGDENHHIQTGLPAVVPDQTPVPGLAQYGQHSAAPFLSFARKYTTLLIDLVWYIKTRLDITGKQRR